MQHIKDIHKFQSYLKSHKTKEELYILKQLGFIEIPFKFQMILGFYILDFVLPTKMINIEVDGGIHNDRVWYDYLRDRFVMDCGFSVIRIPNDDVCVFDYNSLLKIPDSDTKLFKSALSKANAKRGKSIEYKKH